MVFFSSFLSNMELKNNIEILRRSRRLQNATPELSGLIGPERTPPKIKAANNNMTKRAPDLSSDKHNNDSSDSDEAENVANEDDSVHTGKNGGFSSNRIKYQTKQFTRSDETKNISGLREKRKPKESFTTNRPSMVQRKATENLSDCAVQEPECLRSSSLPLNDERLPTSHASSSKIFQLIRRNWPYLIFVFVIPFCALFSPSAETKCKTEEKLQQQFPKQTDKLWSYVQAGRSFSEKPFVLLLVHDDYDGVASCLAEQIAKHVACHRTNRVAKPEVIDGRNLLKKSNIISMKEKLEYSKALVVLHVEDLTPDVAAFFHYVLDVEEPWVSRGVFVLTLHVPNIHMKNVNSKNVYNAVRNFLMRKWSGYIEEDKMDPLITRFGNYEYVVKEDRNICH